MRNVLGWWIVLLAALPLFACAEDGASVQSEQVHRLLNELDSEDYDIRANAFAALQKLGPQVWPQLEHALDADGAPEVPSSLSKLAREWAILTKDQTLMAAAFREKLFGMEIDRVTACNGLLAMGPAGLKFLRESLGSAKAKPVLNVALDKGSFRFDEPVRTHVELRNDGLDPIWHTRTFLYHRWLEGPDLGEPRPHNINSRRSVRGVFRCGNSNSGYVNPIIRWTPIMPGQTYVLPGSPEELIRSTASYRNMGAYSVEVYGAFDGGTIYPRLDPEVSTRIDLEIGKGIAAPLNKPTQSVPYYVFPDFEKECRDLQLDVVCEIDVERATVGQQMQVTARFSPKYDGPDLVLEEDLVKYAWYAFLSEEGTPARSGSLASALVKDEGALHEAQRVKSRASVAYALDLTPPQSPGSYRLVIGYETGERYSKYGTLTPCFGSVGLTPDVVCYNEGRIWSKPVEVTVLAPDADE